MSANFYELLKYAQTGIASPDMTYYDKLRASTLMGGTVQTLTGIPPLSFPSDGSPLISLSMKGNTQQTGTPSPDNIIMPTFCGVRTANLFDKNAPDRTTTGYIKSDGTIQTSTSFSTSGYIPISGFETITLSGYGGGTDPAYCLYDSNKEYISGSAYIGRGTLVLTVGEAAFIRMSYRNTAVNATMLNAGSPALPYEPFGWAEKITCGGETTPVYLEQTQTVRKIRKMVLDGTEGWSPETTNVFTTYATMPKEGYKDLICTHYGLAASYSDLVSKNNVCAVSKRPALFIKDSRFTTSADFKAYLAAQYANGTPVTVWYVLATPQTGTINEPLAKIGDYADELHSEDAAVTIPTVKGDNMLTVETDLQPSEMTITFKG